MKKLNNKNYHVNPSKCVPFRLKSSFLKNTEIEKHFAVEHGQSIFITALFCKHKSFSICLVSAIQSQKSEILRVKPSSRCPVSNSVLSLFSLSKKKHAYAMLCGKMHVELQLIILTYFKPDIYIPI